MIKFLKKITHSYLNYHFQNIHFHLFIIRNQNMEQIGKYLAKIIIHRFRHALKESACVLITFHQCHIQTDNFFQDCGLYVLCLTALTGESSSPDAVAYIYITCAPISTSRNSQIIKTRYLRTPPAIFWCYYVLLLNVSYLTVRQH